ncbi:MAG: DUF4124 domain-containing protein [Betaproteobacteria bacterium]|nr:DUF4124 domain-containing protein [Betaproteobacteria bacterium]
MPMVKLSPAPGGAYAPSASLSLSSVLPVPALAQVYKWVDEHGKVHYGDAPPDHAQGKKKPVKIETPAQSPGERDAALKRAEAERRKLDHLTHSRRNADENAKHRPATATIAPTPPNETPCQKEWREFRERAACFAPYRTATGGIKAEAYQKCKEAVQPSSVCPP